MKVMKCMVVAVLATSAMGCVVNAADEEQAAEEPAIAEVQQGIGWSIFAWGSLNAPPLDLGPDTTQTCVLAGVAGDLNDGGVWQQAWASSATVRRKNGRYQLAAHGGGDYGGNPTNNPVGAHAVCFPTTAGRTGDVWEPGQAAKNLGAITAQRECFLAGVWGVAGTWRLDGNFVEVRKNFSLNRWELHGNLTKNPVTDEKPGAMATCIDLPNTTRLPFDYEAGTAPVTVDLIHQSNAACALQRVQGRFEFQDWSNGTLLIAGAGGNWDLTLGPRKRGRGVCLI